MQIAASWLARAWRRWWVPRSDYDKVVDALRVAKSLIVRHHDCSIVQIAGCYCPVCHRSDGNEPEMDLINDALNGGRKSEESWLIPS